MYVTQHLFLTTWKLYEYFKNSHIRINLTTVQFSHSVVSNSLPPHGLQHTRLPCPSPTPEACSNSCPSSWLCHPAISSSVDSFFSCLQSFPTSGSFPMSQFFTSGGQIIGLSVSASVFPPVSIQDWFPLGWASLISLQSKRLSRVFSNTSSKASVLWLSAFFIENSQIHTWLLEKPYLWLDGPLLAK